MARDRDDHAPTLARRNAGPSGINPGHLPRASPRPQPPLRGPPIAERDCRGKLGAGRGRFRGIDWNCAGAGVQARGRRIPTERIVKLFRPALFLTAGLAATAAFAATIPAPPATLAGDVADVIDGVKVADPYRWLENWDDPKVEAWSDAQNTRTRTYL
ncbi:MAG: hypothetical protein J0I02_05040, partial [Alphaproteobacteria bacterium]|nr:hypothetical protein [Alphaproteobacteria bacterium]